MGTDWRKKNDVHTHYNLYYCTIKLPGFTDLIREIVHELYIEVSRTRYTVYQGHMCNCTGIERLLFIKPNSSLILSPWSHGLSANETWEYGPRAVLITQCLWVSDLARRSSRQALEIVSKWSYINTSIPVLQSILETLSWKPFVFLCMPRRSLADVLNAAQAVLDSDVVSPNNTSDVVVPPPPLSDETSGKLKCYLPTYF